MRRLLLASALALALATPTLAAGLTAPQITQRVTAAQAAVKDVKLHLVGQLRQGGKLLDAELEILAIPGAELRRITFLAPAAMADNVIVLEHDLVRRYLALPHQVFVSSAASAAKSAPMDFQRFAGLMNGDLARYPVKLLRTEAVPGGTAAVLEIAVEGQTFRLWVLEGAWRPARMQVLDGGLVAADWRVASYESNTGLTPAVLKALPADAEVIRR